MYQILLVKKLVAIIIIYTLITSTSKKVAKKVRDLNKISYICYSVLFQKIIKKIEILTLINFKSDINTINFVYAAKLGF